MIKNDSKSANICIMIVPNYNSSCAQLPCIEQSIQWFGMQKAEK